MPGAVPALKRCLAEEETLFSLFLTKEDCYEASIKDEYLMNQMHLFSRNYNTTEPVDHYVGRKFKEREDLGIKSAVLS